MPSTDLKDAEPELVARFKNVRNWFEGNLPSWGLRVECTLRSDAEQLEAYLSGHSKLDPRVPLQHANAKHLANAKGLSRAIDVAIFSRASGRSADQLLAVKGLSNGSYELLYLVLMLLAERAGLRSGNDWNRDGLAVGPDTAEGFFDGGHMELEGG